MTRFDIRDVHPEPRQMTDAQQIADRLVVKMLNDCRLSIEHNRPQAKVALLEAGLGEAVARMETARTLLFNLNGEAAIARREINLALAALKGEKA